MSKVISPAGDQNFEIKSVDTDIDGFIMIGRMGVWDAEVHLSYGEIFLSFLNPKAILAMIKIPFLLFKGLFRPKGK